MKKLFIILLERLVVSLISVGISLSPDEACPTDFGSFSSGYTSKKFQKGMCYVSWEKERYSSHNSDKSIESLAKTGTNCISIITTWYQRDLRSPHIYPTYKTPADSSLRHAIRKSHELNLKVMLKPHVDIIDTQDGSWRGDIFFYNEADWKRWFRDYKKFITHYAKLAQGSGVDIFCIGTELSATIDRKDEWIDIIRSIRKVYKGPLTYAANWNEEFYKIQFWGELDFAGMDAYFPLSTNVEPAFNELKAEWEKNLRDIESWAKPLGKPIIFTEVGYPSTPYAAILPWEEQIEGEPDLKIQANCYRALLETAWGKEWLAGIYWWNWNAVPDAGGPNDKGFTPQNKPAQEILAEWYRK